MYEYVGRLSHYIFMRRNLYLLIWVHNDISIHEFMEQLPQPARFTESIVPFKTAIFKDY